MERKALQESAGHLGQRMKELGTSIDRIKLRCCQLLLPYGFSMGQMLGTSRESSTTCSLTRMLLWASLVIFVITGFFLYDKVRGLRRYNAEMERVRAELRENRHRLLKLGMDHDASLVEIATAGTSWWMDAEILAYRIGFSFVISTCLVMYGVYTFGCHR